MAASVREQGAGENCTLRGFVLLFFFTVHYYSYKIEEDEVGRAELRHCRGLVTKTARKRPLGRFRLTFKVNIKTYIKELGLECLDWINVAQDRDQWRVHVNKAMNLWIA